VIGWRSDRRSLIGAANGAAQLSLLGQSPLHSPAAIAAREISIT